MPLSLIQHQILKTKIIYLLETPSNTKVIDSHLNDYFTSPIFDYSKPKSVLFKVWGLSWLKKSGTCFRTVFT